MAAALGAEEQDAGRLAALDLVEQPIFALDLNDGHVVWANRAGLGFWQVDSVAALARGSGPRLRGQELQQLQACLADLQPGTSRDHVWHWRPATGTRPRSPHGSSWASGRVGLAISTTR